MPTLSNAARSAAVDASVDRLNNGSGAGKIRIYSGTKPAGPDTAITSQTLLAEFTLSDPVAAAASNGVKTLSGTPKTTTGLAAGTAAWFRAVDSNNVAEIDGTVGTSGADLILNTLTVSVGLNLELTSGSFTQPA